MVNDAVWEPVPGFPGYERTRFGEFRSWWTNHGSRRQTPRLLKQNLNPNGYLRVSLMRDRKQHWVYVAEAVLEMNVGPRPPGLVVCHAPDRTKTNNSPDNLRWGTRQDNADDMVVDGTQAKGATHGRKTKPDRTARGERHGRVKITDEQVARIIAEAGPKPRTHGTISRLARENGVTPGVVWRIVEGISWKHHANSPTALNTMDPGGTSLSDVCGP